MATPAATTPPLAGIHRSAEALHAIFSESPHGGSDALAAGLSNLLDLLAQTGVEGTARLQLSWPGRDLSAELLDLLFSLTAEKVAGTNTPVRLREVRLCVAALGQCFRAGVTPHQLKCLFDLLNPEPGPRSAAGVHGVALAALEAAARARVGRRALPPAFWSFPGLVAPGAPGQPDVPESYLSYSWAHWPFPREFGLWTLARAVWFPSNWAARPTLTPGGVPVPPAPSDCACLLRVSAGNGAKLQVWLEENALCLYMYDPPEKGGDGRPIPVSPAPGGGSSGSASSSSGSSGGGFFGAAARTALGVASSVRGAIQHAAAAAVAAGTSPSRGVTTYPGGHSVIVVPAAGLVAGSWVSIHIHHARKKGLLTTGLHELVVSIDGTEQLRTGEVAFPRSLAAAPLLTARSGEGLEGELGPLYFFDDVGAPLSQKQQTKLLACHTGDAVTVVHPGLVRAAAAGGGSGSSNGSTTASTGQYDGDDGGEELPQPLSVFHPASYTWNGRVAAAPEGGGVLARLRAHDGASPHDVTCECLELAGIGSSSAGGGRVSGAAAQQPAAVRGHGGVQAAAGTSIRDALNGLGGLPALLPLFGTSLATALSWNAAGKGKGGDAAGPLALEDGSAAGQRQAAGKEGDGSAASQAAAQQQAADGDHPPSLTAQLLQDFAGPTVASGARSSSGRTTASAVAGADGEEHRSVASQMLTVLALFLRDHPPNCMQALRSSLLQLVRLEIAPQLKGSAARSAAPPSCAPPADARPSSVRCGPRFNARYPAHSDPTLVPALMSLASAAAALPELRLEVWRIFCCWFPLFACTAADVQLQLFSAVEGVVRARPDYFRNDVTIAFLAEAIHHWHVIAASEADSVACMTADDLILGRLPTPSTPVSTAVSKGSPRSAMPFLMRSQLLRELFKIMGCALAQSLVVLHPSELAASVAAPGQGGAAAAATNSGGSSRTSMGGVSLPSAFRAKSLAAPPPALPESGVSTCAPLRKRDVEPLLQLLTPASLSWAPAAAEADAPGGASPRQIFQSEVLNFLTGLLDYEASHAFDATAEALREAAGVLMAGMGAATSSQVAPSAAGMGTASSSLRTCLSDCGLLLGARHPNAAAALDDAAGGDFLSFLLSSVLQGCRGSDLVTAAAVRLLVHTLRANTARPGKLCDQGVPGAIVAKGAAADLAGNTAAGGAAAAAAAAASKSKASAASAAKVQVRNVANKEKLAALLSALPSVPGLVTGLPEAAAREGPRPGPTYDGAQWSASFARSHGFDVLYYLLRDGCPLTERTYGVLLEAAYAGDAVAFAACMEAARTGGSSSGSGTKGLGRPAAQATADGIASATLLSADSAPWHADVVGMAASDKRGGVAATAAGIAGDVLPANAWTPEARALSLTGTVSANWNRASGALPWFPAPACGAASQRAPPPTRCFASPAAVNLILRLLPRMSPQLRLRALRDLHLAVVGNAVNRTMLLKHVPGWEIRLFLLLLPLTPRPLQANSGSAVNHEANFPAPQERSLCRHWYPHRSMPSASVLWSDAFFGFASGCEAQQLGEDSGSASSMTSSTDGLTAEAAAEMYRLAEDMLLVLSRASIDRLEGWRPVQRLLALQPLLEAGARAEALQGQSLSGPGYATVMQLLGPAYAEWDVAVPALPLTTRHGRRLLLLVIGHIFHDIDSNHSVSLSRVHMDNLVHITALVDRQVTGEAWTSPAFLEAVGVSSSPRPTTGSKAVGSGTTPGSPAPPTAAAAAAALASSSGEDEEQEEGEEEESGGLGDGILAALGSVLGATTTAAKSSSEEAEEAEGGDGEGGEASPPAGLGAVTSLGVLPLELTLEGRSAGGLSLPAPAPELDDAAAASDDEALAAGAAGAAVISAPTQLQACPSERFDGLLARLTLGLWDRLLFPLPDRIEKVLALVPLDLQLCGSLGNALTSMTLWTIANFPPAHVDVMHAFARLPKLLAQAMREVVPAASLASVVGQQKQQQQPVQTEPLAVAAVPPPTADGEGDAAPAAAEVVTPTADAPTAPVSPDATVSPPALEAPLSEEDDAEWEEVPSPGRPGIRPEYWLFWTVAAAHAFFKSVAKQIASSGADGGASPVLPHHRHDDIQSSVHMAVTLLKTVSEQCVYAVEACHRGAAATGLAAFLAAYDALQSGWRARQMAGPDASSSLGPLGYLQPWLDGQSAPGQAWLQAPHWSSAVHHAIRIIHGAHVACFELVDTRSAKTWYGGVVQLLALDYLTVVVPLGHVLEASPTLQKALLSRAQERSSVTLPAPDALLGAPAASTADSTVAARPTVTSVSRSPSSALPGASRVRKLASKLQRLANRLEVRLDAVGSDGVLATIRALGKSRSEADPSSASSSLTPEEEYLVTLGAATLAPPDGVSAFALSLLGGIKLARPRWYDDHWAGALVIGALSGGHLDQLDGQRRYTRMGRREDVLGTMRATHRRVMKRMTLERGAWDGNARLAGMPMKLSSFVDGIGRRLRLVPNRHALDFSAAAYKPLGAGAGSGSSAQSAAPAAPEPASAAATSGLDPTLLALSRQLKRMPSSGSISPGAALTSGRDEFDLDDDEEEEAPGVAGTGAQPAAVSAAPAASPAAATAPASAVSALAAAAESSKGVATTFFRLPHEVPRLNAIKCKRITVDKAEDGRFYLTSHFLYFDPDDDNTAVRGGGSSPTASAPAAPSTSPSSSGASVDASASKTVVEDGATAAEEEGFVEVGESEAAASAAVGEVFGRACATAPKPAAASGTPPTPACSVPGPVGLTIPVRPAEPRRWSLRTVRAVLPRRHLLQPCAVEIFFTDGRSVMLAFPRARVREVLDALDRSELPCLESWCKPALMHPGKIWRASKIAERWARREISNFEYLLWVNAMAGRTFSDPAQYPVFPWVISNYTSPTLDLSDPANFRDLSKPVGALNPRRLRLFRERLEALGEGSDIPPFMYGSHYSSAGVVIFYLIRLEPFSSMAVELQNGHFDCPDRLFFSVPECWHGVTNSMSDVKELVPEWYCLPDMFRNASKLPLGRLQDNGGAVDDVILPPWARTPEEFVWVNRAALESEYVSAHLHEWIDLVFGCKQQGQAAAEADNLFYYLTYAGAVDLESIPDPIMRRATEAQIAHFGQTPVQLTRRPHPPRLPAADCPQPLFGFDLPLSLPGATINLSAFGRAGRAGGGLLKQTLLRNLGATAIGAVSVVAEAVAGLGALGAAAVSAVAAGVTQPPAAGAARGPVASIASGGGAGEADAAAPPSPAPAAPAASSGTPLVPATSLSRFTGNAATPSSAPSEPASGGDGGDVDDWNGASVSAVSSRQPVEPQLLTDRGLAVFTAAVHPGNAAQAALIASQAKMASQVLASWASAAAQGVGVAPAMLSQSLLAARPLVFPTATSWTCPSQQAVYISPIPGSGRVLCLHGDGSFVVYKWSAAMTLDGLPFELKPADNKGTRALAGAGLWASHRLRPLQDGPEVPSTWAAGLALTANGGTASSAALLDACAHGRFPVINAGNRFAVVTPADAVGSRPASTAAEPVLFSCGYLDGSLRWQSALHKNRCEGWNPTASLHHRLAGVTALAAAGPHSFVTGHADGTVNLWYLCNNDESNFLAACEKAVSLRGPHGDGHFTIANASLTTSFVVAAGVDALAVRLASFSGLYFPVTAMAASPELGLLAAGAADGSVGVYNLTTGRILHVIDPRASAPITAVFAKTGTPKPPQPPPQLRSPGFVPAPAAPAAATALPASRVPPVLPVQHLLLLPTGFLAVHWLWEKEHNPHEAHHPASPLARTLFHSASSALRGHGPSSPEDARRFRSVLGLVHINGTVAAVERVLPAKPLQHDAAAAANTPASGYGFPYIVTSLTATADGTGLLLGMSDGEVQARHGLTLECGGYFRAHQEPEEMREAAEKAVAATLPEAQSGGSSSAPAPAPAAPAPSSSSSSFSFSSALSRLRTPSAGSVAAAAPPTPQSVAALAASRLAAAVASCAPAVSLVPGGPGRSLFPAAAITSICLVDEERACLLGCGDGRVCVVTDPAQAQKTLAQTLQQGLFSIV